MRHTVWIMRTSARKRLGEDDELLYEDEIGDSNRLYIFSSMKGAMEFYTKYALVASHRTVIQNGERLQVILHRCVGEEVDCGQNLGPHT